MELKCSKCGFTGGRAEWRYLGVADPSGTTSFRTCPKCNYPEVCEELAADNQFEGPEPWGLSKFRGKVFKGKKTAHINGNK